MKERYSRVISNIAPERSDRDLFETVIRKAEIKMEKRKLNKKAVVIPVAAALTVAISVGGFAAVNSDYLRSIFGGNESITENIHNSVFEDSDEHIKITVEEYLSDGQCTYLTVHYQALDEEGEQWLSGDFLACEAGEEQLLAVHPEFQKSTEVYYPKSYSINAIEITELSAETDKYFNVFFETTSRFYGTEKADFRYILTDGEQRSTILDISDNVESKWIELKSEKSPSEFYIPKYLVLSDLSFSIHGENTGAYEDNSVPGVMWSFHSLMSHEEDIADAVNDISFVFSDGSEYVPDPYALLGSSVACEENRNTDIDIAGGTFVNRKWDDNGNFIISFDDVAVDDIVGLKFGDVYYELSAE